MLDQVQLKNHHALHADVWFKQTLFAWRRIGYRDHVLLRRPFPMSKGECPHHQDDLQEEHKKQLLYSGTKIGTMAISINPRPLPSENRHPWFAV